MFHAGFDDRFLAESGLCLDSGKLLMMGKKM
jgi:hypothetical protein